MSAKEQAAVILQSILASFRMAMPDADPATLENAARAAANNAAMALAVEE